MKKLFSLIVTIIMVSLVAAAFLGCDPEKHDYTVRIIGIDGKPCTSVGIKACEPEDSDNEIKGCYSAFCETDKDGYAFLDVGEGKIPATASESLEIHVYNKDGSDLPMYITYNKTVLKKGESTEITLRIKGEGDYDSYLGGNGTASYLTDEPNKLDTSEDTFKPYEVKVPLEGAAFELKFTSAEQKIYFAVMSDSDWDFNVFSYGDVDAKITELIGSKEDGIVKSADEQYTSDNISETDKNFSYDFTIENGSEGTGAAFKVVYQIHYFEVSLVNAEHVNRSALICFRAV